MADADKAGVGEGAAGALVLLLPLSDTFAGDRSAATVCWRRTVSCE